jgi:glutamate formiminotransferase / 5-formyltetrahydrofolate cyclo-ligase
MLECVPNVAEGRDRAVLDTLVRACGPPLLDLHVDADHHRSVFTLAARASAETVGAARDLARGVAALVDLRTHRGVHPRLGALDVVPFVALDGQPVESAVDAACGFAEWIASELAVPVFLYDRADAHRRSLPSVRRDAFTTRAPDHGPGSPHPRLGAVAVGARFPLLAVNCELGRDDLALARHIADEVRERDGGLRGVRALGLRLGSVGHVQVSMNLTDLEGTGLQYACESVRDRARAAGTDVSRVELVGLAPAAELERCDSGFLDWARLGTEQTIEYRLTNRSH